MANFSKKTLKIMMKYLRAEETSSAVYAAIAKRIKDQKNKDTLLKISAQEKTHAAIWQNYTGKNIGPNKLKVIWHVFASYLFGYTFIIKFLERGEYASIEQYRSLEGEVSEIAHIVEQEKSHEQQLAGMLDEEMLKYSGSMALGISSALVELTGALAGFTLAFANARIAAMAGIITVATVTLSTSASHYLTDRSEENPRALKNSVYSGATYLITSVLLLAPYFIYPHHMYIAALITMLVMAIFVGFFFTYYITTAKSRPFFKHFVEMIYVSIGIAAIAFIIGLLARKFLGIAG